MENNYLHYLNNITSVKTFNRKIDYIDYNFGKYLKFKHPHDVNVLEIGPGMGELLKYLNDRDVFAIDVVDNDDSILNTIKNNHRINRLLKTDNLEEIDNELYLYDTIILTQVLEHIEENKYAIFLKTLFKHLKKGGHLIITVPNMANIFSAYERYGDITHKNGFTDNSLRQLANKYGLIGESIVIQPFRIPPYSLLNIIRSIMQKILYFFIYLVSIISGGSYSKLLTPNITLVIKK